MTATGTTCINCHTSTLLVDLNDPKVHNSCATCHDASGGLIGIAAGIGAVSVIATLSGWHTAITPWAIAAPLVMSILAGIFFGLYPAVQAARMDPVAALRHE